MVHYSILSKAKKPRISADDFMRHYHINDKEINREILQEFLDFFEISDDDLHMKSKTEVFFTLQGFLIDREAEKLVGADSSHPHSLILPSKIKTVVFSHLSSDGWVDGKIEFDNQNLIYNKLNTSISLNDQDILLQAINDLGIISSNLYGTTAKQAGKVEIFDIDDRRYPVKDLSSHEILFQIVEAIAG